MDSGCDKWGSSKKKKKQELQRSLMAIENKQWKYLRKESSEKLTLTGHMASKRR